MKDIKPIKTHLFTDFLIFKTIYGAIYIEFNSTNIYILINEIKMDKRLEKLFEESRIRHSKQNGKDEILKPIKQKQSEEVKRAKNLIRLYKWHDEKHNFIESVDFDAEWIVNNIFSEGCVYCGETDWKKLGCDRINNSKPHTKDNVVPCCKRCNVLRGNKFTVDEMKEIGAVIKRIENRHKDYCVRSSKKVASFDENGNIIKQYKAASQVQVDGLSPKMVRRACQKYSDGYKYKGLYWRYI